MSILSITKLNSDDIDEIAMAFQSLGWNKTRAQYEKYLSEQEKNLRTIFVARLNGNFAGYTTLVWNSEYQPFADKNIPEIKDLNVLPVYRKQGVGRKLMDACETLARQNACKELGLGVGLVADYGSAQRLYSRLGYLPDGAGLHYGARAVSYNQQVTADDDLVLYLSKSI